ncbi:MAG: YitT family protein [Clostridia bacterium]|nr:YitT family protein [Clostridia bacterium]
MALTPLKAKESAKTALCILAGNALLAFAVAAFIIPHALVMGGTTGIALVLARFLPINTALIVLLLNTVLLVLGLLILGKKLFFTSIASTFLYPAFLALFQSFPALGQLTQNRLLAALFGGGLMGLAMGLVMRVGSSTGGTDISNLIFAKLTHRRVAVFVSLSDLVIVAAQAFVSDSESILIGIVVLALEALVLDYVTVFGQAQIQLFVVSERAEAIKEYFLGELQAGVTMQLIQTGLRGKAQKAVLCIIPPRKLYAANEMINRIDPAAFITITKIKEVRGKGFTRAR